LFDGNIGSSNQMKLGEDDDEGRRQSFLNAGRSFKRWLRDPENPYS